MGGFSIRRVAVSIASALLLASANVVPALAAPDGAGVAGRVVAATQPIAEATVYAYQVVEKTLRKVVTDEVGGFRFADLPAGLYKIVAHKSGFLPAIAVVAHKRLEEAQFVEVELAPQEASAAADFWSLRSEIPADVLREMDAPLVVAIAALTPAAPPHSEFLTEMSAVTGIEQLAPEATAQVAVGRVGVRGRLGEVRLQLEGDYQTLDSGLVDWSQDGAEGRSSALRLNLEGPSRGRFDLTTVNHSSLTVVDGDSYPVDYSQVQVKWRRPVGASGTTGFLAQYVSESGLYSKGWVDPVTIPLASRALRLEGSYGRDLGDRARLRTGVRYRERVADYAPARGLEDLFELGEIRSFDAYGIGDWDLASMVVLQYGLYTTLRDGTLSLTPRGGVLLRLGPFWQASALATHRVASDAAPQAGAEFTPTLLEQTLACEDTELSCYQLQLQRGSGESDLVVVGASYRELDRTVRLFFSDAFFARSEGLFLVPGDRLPEVHASVRRRVAPSVVARVASNYASGGGGAFLAQNRRVYQNEVSYLTTSVDTTFEATATGVYLAFHRLDQRLEPLWSGPRRKLTTADVRLERLELVFSQDLAPLFDIASDWAVQVGLELSRGATLFQADPEDREALRHRLLTGFAVRF